MNGSRITAVAVLAVLACAAGAAAHWPGHSRRLHLANELHTPFQPQFDQYLEPCWFSPRASAFDDPAKVPKGGETALIRLYYSAEDIDHIRLHADRVEVIHFQERSKWESAHTDTPLSRDESPPEERSAAPLDPETAALAAGVLARSIAAAKPVERRASLDGFTYLFSAGPGSCVQTHSPYPGTRVGSIADLVDVLRYHASLTDPAELAESSAAIRAAAQRVERTALYQP